MTKTFSEYVVDRFRDMVESGRVNADDLFEFMNFVPAILDEGESAEDYLMALDDGIDIWHRLFPVGTSYQYPWIHQHFEDKYTLLADIFDQAASDLRTEYDFVDELIDNMADEAGGYDDPIGFFKDLQTGGCISGMVGMFIYNSDCKKFYIDHIDSMEDFVEALEGDMGEPIKNNQHLPRYTFICWLCYEELAYRIARELWPNEF